MSFENPTFEVKIEVEVGYDNFVPEEFKQDPLGYFEREGKNIKLGEVKRDETGRVREDPTAVKELPVWSDATGQELATVGKRVNVEKGKVGESGDPFYEYQIMMAVREAGLPAPRPIAKVEQVGAHLIIMEKVPGIGAHSSDVQKLKEAGYTDQDLEILKGQAEAEMEKLKALFDEAGIERQWKLKDMIIDLDIAQKKINKITPVDWERTKINQEKLEASKNG